MATGSDSATDAADTGSDSAPDVVPDAVDAAPPCPTGQTRCDLSCVDTAADGAHCGACGRRCAPGQSCVAGVCGCPFAGQTYCTGVGCINTATDVSNCGACGNRCAEGMLCSAGVCRCPSGQTLCGAACVDTSSSATHCGVCGRACDGAIPNAVSLCAAGSCVQVACRSGFGDCNAAAGCETNLATDANNCGACNTRCRFTNATATCAASACVMGACNTGFADCNRDPADGCETNLMTEATDCGTCRNACTAPTGRTAYCASGACMVGATCAAPTADCDGASGNGCEVNVNTSVANCGACGAACDATNGTPTCASGACVSIACFPGFGNCDGSLGNGCEVDFASNDRHCGGCGNRCTFPNAAASCALGACRLGACDAGWGNCDGSPSNGCETALTTTSNCGRCGGACASGQSCSSGMCCPAGQTACSGACRNLQTDTNHCGACGAVCASGLCEAGVCVRVVDVAMGQNHTCAAMSDGSVRCWGSNPRGQLGRESLLAARATPGTVSGVTATRVAAGQEHSCAMAVDGTLRCWGGNGAGELGAGFVSPFEPDPQRVVSISTAVEVTAGGAYTCARLASGAVSCWGSSTLVGLASPTCSACATPLTIDGVADATALDAWADFTCMLRGSGGALWCWGSDSLIGFAVMAPRQISAFPSGVLSVAAGGDHACVVLTDRTVRCWGRGAEGQLGNGMTRDLGYGDAAPVAGLTNVAQLAAGYRHTCALRMDGTVWCWGSIFGAGSGLTATAIPGLAAVADIAAGQYNVCARRMDGALRCWGQNSSGQLGDGTFTTRADPVAVVWR